MATQQPQRSKAQSYNITKKLVAARAHEIAIVDKFNVHGYRNREDNTMLPPGVLVNGSQNVVTNTSGRVSIVKGYTLDGGASATLAAIQSSYDFLMHTGITQHLRTYTDPVSNLGVIQYRYKDASNVVTWRDLSTTQASGNINYCTFWDFNGELKQFMLFVLFDLA